MSGLAFKSISHANVDRAFRQCSGMEKRVVLETWLGLVSNGKENKWGYPLPESE